MEQASWLAIAVIAFASTNVDDLFVLLGFHADPAVRTREVVLGQCLGIGALLAASLALAQLAVAVPHDALRWLGVLPILVGVKKWSAACLGRTTDASPPPRGTASGAFAVAAVTIANGGDNIGVYVPLVAGRAPAALVAMGAVFAAMTALWLALSYWLVAHPTLGAPIRRHGGAVVPPVLVAIGVWILVGR